MSESIIVGAAASDADVKVNDEYVSTHHARIWRDIAGVWVEDLGSLNGTYVNGRQIYGRTPLGQGDRLRVGHTEVVVPLLG